MSSSSGLVSCLLVSLLGCALASSHSGRIVGGEEVLEGDIPWQVSVTAGGTYRCGGVIISEQYLLTAARCLAWGGLRFGAGSVQLYRPLSWHRAEWAWLHPDYNSTTLEHDLAIVKVDPPFELGETIAAVRLPDSDHVTPTGTLATFSGWGNTEYSSVISEVLLKADLPVLQQAQCASTHGRSEGVMCTDLGAHNEDPCQQDAGGPLVVQGELRGVLSAAWGCHQLIRLPALYVNVASYRGWIYDVTGL